MLIENASPGQGPEYRSSLVGLKSKRGLEAGGWGQHTTG